MPNFIEIGCEMMEKSRLAGGGKEPEVSDETGALLVYSRFITFKSFSHRPTSIEHAELLGM